MQTRSPPLLPQWRPTVLHPEPARQMTRCPAWRAEPSRNPFSLRPRRRTKEVNTWDCLCNTLVEGGPQPQGGSVEDVFEITPKPSSLSFKIYLALKAQWGTDNKRGKSLRLPFCNAPAEWGQQPQGGSVTFTTKYIKVSWLLNIPVLQNSTNCTKKGWIFTELNWI